MCADTSCGHVSLYSHVLCILACQATALHVSVFRLCVYVSDILEYRTMPGCCSLPKTKCRDPGSNRGPSDLRSDALPTELSRLDQVVTPVLVSGKTLDHGRLLSIWHVRANEESSQEESPLWGSSPRPYAYEAHALPTELRRHLAHSANIVTCLWGEALEKASLIQNSGYPGHTVVQAKDRKADSTLRSSQAVPHPSTDRALRCLTSEVKRDPVHSTRYGRRRQ